MPQLQQCHSTPTEASYRNMSIGRVPGTSGISPTIVDAKGDLIAATAADSVSRLAVGANETRLVADSAAATGLKYVADTTNYAIAAKGDLLAGTAADTVAALTVGANNLFLGAASGESTGLKWLGDGISFTPSWTNLTVGNGSNVCRYIQIGKMVFVQGSMLFGSTSSISGAVSFTLPVTADVNNSYLLTSHNSVSYIDWGSTEYVGYAYLDNSTTVKFRITNVAGTYPVRAEISSTVPMTWANQDILVYSFVYLGA